jgi:hypothetical protein
MGHIPTMTSGESTSEGSSIHGNVLETPSGEVATCLLPSLTNALRKQVLFQLEKSDINACSRVE